ncbi:MAG: PadR family transcriptional regulator [Ilumatobacteraceae bacterium]
MTVREGLLALLQDGPRYGYQLKTEFEAATGGVWPLNVGQVYTTLDRLERDGMVRIQEGASTNAQKIYEITDGGLAEVGAWWQAVPADEPPPRDELMLKVLMAIEHDAEHGLRVVTHQRTQLLALLAAKRRERAAQGDAGLAATLVTEALVARAEADLRWLDRCEAALVRRRTEHDDAAEAAGRKGTT